MKIAWFGHVASARRNGIVTYSRQMLTGFSARQVDVVFFFHATRERHLVTPPNVRAVRIGALDILNRATVSSLRAERTIQHILQTESPQAAHVSLSFSNLDATLPELCHSIEVPIVATLHIPYGPPGSFWGNAAKVLYRLYVNTLDKYDAVIVFSEEQKRLLEAYGVERADLRVLPNGVDVNRYTPGPPDYKLELGAQLLVSYVGRVDPEKNVGVLCEAFSAIDFPDDHRLVIVGDGIELGRLRRKYGDDPRIVFRGHVNDPAELHKVLRSSDIFVLPSSLEGLSIAMLEAMASGAAVIATNVGADGEALRGAGIVLDLDALDKQLPLALRTLVEFPDFRKHLGQAARARAVEHYSLQRNLDRLIHLYHDLYRHSRAPYRI